ncbi:MAG: nucleotidyltransferase domain-containing protein [Dehalococcoidia bacterium]|nr:nucleotidyltransferase domain-containing protein [Dehalococcoidia bacterium]
MVTRTKPYRKSMEELKKELLTRLGQRIDSIILYGSAARGQYRPLESDIDVLVVGQGNDGSIKREISEIIGSIDLENSTATSPVYLSRENFRRYLEWGSPFLENVLEEGFVLYDNGTFEQVRRNRVKAGG